MPSALDDIRTVSVDTNVVLATLNVLQHYGSYECEGLVLWVGSVADTIAHVTRMIVPDQHPMKSEEGVGYFVDAEALFALNKTLADTGLRLIAQVHSHPGEAYHSAADDRYAIITANGGLSFVVPDFGRAPADPSSWAVYRLNDCGWRELSHAEIQSLVIVGEANDDCRDATA